MAFLDFAPDNVYLIPVLNEILDEAVASPSHSTYSTFFLFSANECKIVGTLMFKY